MNRRYAVLTAARNEADALPRLAESLAGQTVPPVIWLILENGSSDATASVAATLAQEYPFAQLLQISAPEGPPVRGGPIVKAIHAGLDTLPDDLSVVMKVDADITLPKDYAERLYAELEQDPELGIVSGSCFEDRAGSWVQQHMTGDMAWCAARAWRRECLTDVLPFTERFGWDTVDIAKARLNGWRTRTLTDLPFQHHRKEGERDGIGAASWVNQGRGSHFLGYRPTYVVGRALGRMRDDPKAIMMVWGYLSQIIKRGPQLPNKDVRELIREDQRWRHLKARVAESSGRR